MPKRGTNIYKRKDGRWEGRVLQSNCLEGKRKYISVYGKTYREVKDKTDNIRQQMSLTQNEYPEISLKEASDIWFTDKAPAWKASTYAAYNNITQKYILPYLGKYSVYQIDAFVMDDFFQHIKLNDSGTPLSCRYLHHICNIVLMILIHIKKKKRVDIQIPDNPVTYCKTKQILLPPENAMMTLENYLFTNIEDDTCLGILIAFYTGVRIGELCAMTWEDIDITEEIIYIRKNMQRVSIGKEFDSKTEIVFQEPKTDTSTRVIPIPPVLLPYLKERHPRAEGFVIKGKRKPFTEPRTLQYRFAKILKECNIQNFHFHMLRHSFATRCIDGGFDIKSLSEILGHSNVQITMNLYVHSTMQHKKQLMRYFSVSLNEKKLIDTSK